MPLDARLVTMDAANPPRWALWAHAILNEATAFGATQQIRDWIAWAGGADFTLIRATGPMDSNILVVQDGARGILHFAGTRSIQQLSGQIVASTLVSDPLGGGNASAFWLEYANRADPFVGTALAPLPVNAPLMIYGHSLGGAIAMIFAARYGFGPRRTVSTLVTSGQPRAGDATVVASVTVPYIRLVNGSDPVPGVPPNGNTVQQIGTILTLGALAYNYRHGGNLWNIGQNRFVIGTDANAATTVQTFADAAMSGPGFQQRVLGFHDINEYAISLRSTVEPVGNRPETATIQTIMTSMIGMLGNNNNQPVPVPVPPLPPQQVVADPNVIIQPIPAHLPIPDLSQVIEWIQTLEPVVQVPNANPILPGQTGAIMSSYVKATFFWIQRNQGWSETYYRPGSIADSVQPAYDLGNQLIQYRGTNTGLNGFRLAIVNAPLTFPKPRVAQLFPPLDAWASGTGSIAGDKDSDAADTCILMRCFSSTAGAGAKFTFWRGIPDNFVTRGGLPVPNGMANFPNWVTTQQIFRAGGWGWLGVSGIDNRQAITEMVQTVTPTGFINFTLAGNLFPNAIPLNVGATVAVRINNVITPGNINGIIPVVIQGNLSQCQSKKRIAILAWDGNSGVMHYNPLQFWPFAAFVPPGGIGNSGLALVRIGERKAGRPSGTPRGRSKNRVRA